MSVAVLKRVIILMMNMKTSGLLEDLMYVSVLKEDCQPVQPESHTEGGKDNGKEYTD
jgi:hypothetical protein